MKRVSTFFIFPMLLIFLAGCATIGPNTIARDRFDYSGGLATSWQNQMLLNIVKLRYMDTPVFLDVTSVINSYTLESEVDLGLSFNNTLGNSQSLGGKGLYSDRPTITYMPLLGDKFTKSLLTPIKPETVFSLIQIGWRADMLMRLSIKSMNGVYNEGSKGSDHPDSDPRFIALTDAFRRIQLSNAIGMKVKKAVDYKTSLLFFRRDVTDETLKDFLFVRETLGLDPEASDLTLRFGSVPANDEELAVLTRSMLEVLIAISLGVEIPPEDIEMTRATPAPTGPGFDPLVRIRSGEEKPEDAFVAIPYRNRWFWVEDTDLDSKRIFTFLVILFTLTETGESAPAPVVTIPAG